MVNIVIERSGERIMMDLKSINALDMSEWQALYSAETLRRRELVIGYWLLAICD
jgi:hypothetical protein